jgi:hypothetical protein
LANTPCPGRVGEQNFHELTAAATAIEAAANHHPRRTDHHSIVALNRMSTMIERSEARSCFEISFQLH